MKLDTTNHDRDSAGMTYVYPVVSRRARGVSIGINLNPNNACNWRCVYCQVPGLTRGAAPELDLVQLERELREMLARAQDPQWMQAHVPEEARRLNDVALSGNGEPTTSEQLGEVLTLLERALSDAGLLGQLRIVLISNGSLVHQPRVRAALEQLARLGGEVWFKLDAATDSLRERLNDTRIDSQRTLSNLVECATACPTWLQTIAVDFEGPALAGPEEKAWIELVRAACERLAERNANPLRGVLLYGLARTSHQPEASRLSALAPAELEALGKRLEAATGLEVRVSP
ncbi:MAG: radical SAM protein [Planctomycetota bacterium]|nr:radical SAM protein [Planctomycetota bacterium]